MTALLLLSRGGKLLLVIIAVTRCLIFLFVFIKMIWAGVILAYMLCLLLRLMKDDTNVVMRLLLLLLMNFNLLLLLIVNKFFFYWKNQWLFQTLWLKYIKWLAYRLVWIVIYWILDSWQQYLALPVIKFLHK